MSSGYEYAVVMLTIAVLIVVVIEIVRRFDRLGK